MVKNLPVIAGDAGDKGLIPGWGRCPRGGNGKPFQCSCLENSMDKNQRGEQKGKGPQCDPSLVLGVLNLRGLMPHDLRWSWLITTLEIKCPVNVIPLNHPKSTPPTPALVHEKTVFHETHSWCQKSWGPLLERVEPSYHSRFSSAVTSPERLPCCFPL